MTKPSDDLDDLYDELSELSRAAKDETALSPREERIIAGFEDIERFYEQNKRLPTHGEDRDIFERLYAVRLDQIRTSEECRSLLADRDQYGLLTDTPSVAHLPEEESLDDDALLAELAELGGGGSDLTQLKHVRPRAEIRAAEEVAQRTPCRDFDRFKPLFDTVQDELKAGVRKSRPYRDDAKVEVGSFFILGGQKVYVTEMGEEFVTEYGRKDSRLRVIYDNGTESGILLRSLQRALNKDEHGRRITDPTVGGMFSDEDEEDDIESGTIYVLRSKSDLPFIKENRDVIHKIGVTGGDLKQRLAIAKTDPTFLMADVVIVTTYKLSNINRTKLENLIHRFFEPARLNIEIKDRFGQPVTPREWFLVPLPIIDEAIEKVKDGTIVNCTYDVSKQEIRGEEMRSIKL